jgi:hypothetical protein
MSEREGDGAVLPGRRVVPAAATAVGDSSEIPSGY